jgi:hypothetical protein
MMSSGEVEFPSENAALQLAQERVAESDRVIEGGADPASGRVRVARDAELAQFDRNIFASMYPLAPRPWRDAAKPAARATITSSSGNRATCSAPTAS